MVRIHVGQPIQTSCRAICRGFARDIRLNQPPPIIEPPVAPVTAVTPTSLAARLLNVFAIPGEVFEEIKASPPNAANWLVPALFAGVIFAITFAFVVARPEFIKKNLAPQQQTIEQHVKDGKTSRADADQMLKLLERLYDASTLKVFGVVGGVVAGFIRVLWWGFVLWLLARVFLRARVRFGKMLEASGLAGMVGLLAVIITTLLEMNLGDQFASAAATKGFDPRNAAHLAIMALNFFHVWQAGVLASALARMTGVPFFRGALVMFPFWLLWMSATAIIGSGLLHLAG